MPIAQINVPHGPDFLITGTGTNERWEQAKRFSIPAVAPGGNYRTEGRVLYSDTGLYVFVSGEDQKLSCYQTEDLSDLFLGDVVEIFLQPDPEKSVYFEYEISPLGYELPLLVSQVEGSFHGWLPWKYAGSRKCRSQTFIRGGEKVPGARCSGWSVECFIPFALLTGLTPPPQAGSIWRANFCRLDYDTGEARHFAWSTSTGTRFHELHSFGALAFQ